MLAYVYDAEEYREGELPSWSGEFSIIDEARGMLQIAVSDTRTHRFPEGWESPSGEPIELPDREVWILVRSE